MDYLYIILLSLLILVILLFLMKRSTIKGAGDQEEDFPDMNEIFLSHAKGRSVVDLVKVFNPSDEMILRSILTSENIDSYVKANHFGDLLGCSQESIFSTSVISIFEDTVGQATIIVQNYISNLYKDQSSAEDGDSTKVHPIVSGMMPLSEIKYIPELLI